MQWVPRFKVTRAKVLVLKCQNVSASFYISVTVLIYLHPVFKLDIKSGVSGAFPYSRWHAVTDFTTLTDRAIRPI